VDRVSALEDAPPLDRTFIDELEQHPAWRALAEQLTDQAAAMVTSLLHLKMQDGQTLEAFSLSEAILRGKILGLMSVLEEPDVIRRSLDERRDR
jgi:hypothetical protein